MNNKIYILADERDNLPDNISTRNWTEVNYSKINSFFTAVKKIKGIAKQNFFSSSIDESTMDIGTDFLYEKHHRSYGRPWMLGKYIYDYLIQRGIQPSDKILDFGCGSGRLGIWLIKFLNQNNYFGMDAHHRSLKAFGEYEIPFHELADKNPTLFMNSKFNMSFFETNFDWIVEVFVSNHIDDSQLESMYSNIVEVLNKDGKYLVTPKPNFSFEKLESYGLKLQHEERQILSHFKGQQFEDYNDWFEFVKI